MSTLAVVYPKELTVGDPGIIAACSPSSQGPVALVIVTDPNANARQLSELVVHLRKRGHSVEVLPIDGDPATALVSAANRYRADLLIKTARPEGQEGRSPYGSVARNLLTESACPVWIACGGSAEPTKVLAAVCLGPTIGEKTLDLEVLDMATRVAAARNAALHVVHAWQPTRALGRSRLGSPRSQRRHRAAEKHAAHKKLKCLLKPYDINPSQVVLRAGAAADVISMVAEEIEAGIVIVGSAARTGLPRLVFGNTAEDVLRRSRRSVIGVRELAASRAVPRAVARNV